MNSPEIAVFSGRFAVGINKFYPFWWSSRNFEITIHSASLAYAINVVFLPGTRAVSCHSHEKLVKGTNSYLDTGDAHTAQIVGSNRCDFGTFSDCTLTQKQRFSGQSASKVGLFAPSQPSWKYAPVLARGASKAVLLPCTTHFCRS